MDKRLRSFGKEHPHVSRERLGRSGDHGNSPSRHGGSPHFRELGRITSYNVCYTKLLRPENEDYPTGLVLANGKKFEEVYGPRGVIHSWADGKGGQRIEDTGPLTKKRMETVDQETLEAAKGFIRKQVEDGKPFFTWWNATRT